MASEMLYPVMPVYLKSIGFSVLLIGILEGVAECAAGLSKGYFGQLSDNKNKRLPFVQLGYLLSAVSKPMLAVFTLPVWVFFSRTVDRLGKGLRTAPRDAMLSLETTSSNKAKVFGFHRALDTFGAVAGPAAALLFLYYYPGQYKILFLLAFVPGVLAVVSTFLLKEKKLPAKPKAKIHFISFLKFYTSAPAAYKKIVKGLLLFACINSSDALLLLKMKESGLHETYIIGIYIFYNIVFALFAFPAGILADKFGIKKTFLAGLVFFVLVYTGFVFSTSWQHYVALFFLYGIYAACTEGIAKAWLTNVVSANEAGTAIGTYTALQSIAALFASSIAGLLWYTFGAAYAFGFTAIVSCFIVVYFMRMNTGRN